MSPNSAELTIDLKIMVLNAENLFLLSDFPLNDLDIQKSEAEWQRLSTSIYPNKSLFKCRELAKIFFNVNPDLILLSEVGGIESLKNYNRLFLQEIYKEHLIQGNSDRHIDVGFLIRKTIPLVAELQTNRDRSINSLEEKFSRDALELHLSAQPGGVPILTCILTHLKSRLDPDGKDPSGFNQRKAELRTLMEIYRDHQKKFGPTVPTLVAGDFNGNASPRKTDPEFQPIYEETDLTEICSHVGLSAESCYSFYQVNRKGPEGRQLDYCFASQSALPFLDSESVKFLSYLTPAGEAAPPPRNLEAKALLPSDHYPLVLRLKGIPLIGATNS